MSPRNQFGSISALSLAANPAFIPVILTAAGIAVTVAAATFAYKAFKEYERKKHRKEVEQINHLHLIHLERILVLGRDETLSLPPIYKFDEKDENAPPDSLHFTDDQIIDIGKRMPSSTDPELTTYRESVLNAILKLKEYYLSRKSRTDITAGVISYLIYMLETKCLSFSGYAYDIAYLEAISNFINAYASLHSSENSQHFTRLTPVYSYLSQAKQLLEERQASLSLEGIIVEIKDACIQQSNELIKILAKFLTKNSHWDYLDTATNDEIAEGTLRREYTHTQVKGVVLKKDSKVSLSNSQFFTSWIKELAGYYLTSIDPKGGTDIKKMISPSELFKMPVGKQLDDIKSAFRECENLLTSQLVQDKNKKFSYEAVSDDIEVINRANIIASVATLIHKIISLQYLCISLLKSIKQLGEIYVKHKNHFTYIFNVLDNLCSQIINEIDLVKKSFSTLQKQNKNIMRKESIEVLPKQLKSCLKTTDTTIKNLETSLKEYRNKIIKSDTTMRDEINEVKHEMFEAAKFLAKIYQLNTPVQNKAFVKQKRSRGQLPKPSSSQASLSETETKKLPEANIKLAIQEEIPVTIHEDSLHRLHIQIDNIRLLENSSNNEIKSYTAMYHILDNLQQKVNSIEQHEPSESPKLIKAMKLNTTIQTLSQIMVQHLAKPSLERLSTCKAFKEAVQKELSDEKNSFIDVHYNQSSKFFYTIFGGSTFQTDTRKRLNSFQAACNSELFSSKPNSTSLAI